MGNKTSNSYSIIKEGVGCCRCNKTNDLRDTIIITDNFRQKQAILIQSLFKGYRIRNKYHCHPIDYSKLCQEVSLTYPTDKYDNNPVILQLKNLIGKFELNEKEKFLIQSAPCKNIALLYFDNSIYKGYINCRWQRETYGIYYHPDGSIYEGFFAGNREEGRGRVYNSNDGFVYDGEFCNSLFNGFGRFMSLEGMSYKGNWKDDKQHGYGEETYIDGSQFAGLYYNGKKNGKGKFLWTNGNKYEGDFVNDEITGFGVYKWKDGKIYCGKMLNHKMNGNGVFLWPDHKKYIGHYLNDQKQGFGIFHSTDGRRFEGSWKEGKQHGKGIVINSGNRSTYVEYYEGKKIKTITDDYEIKVAEKELQELKLEYQFDILNAYIKDYESLIDNFLKEDIQFVRSMQSSETGSQGNKTNSTK